MPGIIKLPIAEETAYIKIKASFRYAKDRLYRTLLVRPHTNLFELGCILSMSLGAEFEHLFSFSTKTCSFFLAPDDADLFWADNGYAPMENHTLDDLGENFTFKYDSGDGWDFTCKVYKRQPIFKDTRKAIILEGKGQGIWEDNIRSLFAYLNGEIDPDSSEEDDELGVYPPWNFEIEKYSDFDKPLDIEALQKKLDDKLESTISFLQMNLSSDGDFCDDDDDDEFAPDDDAEAMADKAMDFLSSALEVQLQNVGFVKKAYQRLEKRHGKEMAVALIFEAFAQEITGLIMQKTPYGSECYKKRLENLK